MKAASATPHLESVLELDRLLATHPFGNSDYITEQMHVAFKRRLGKISNRLPAAGQLLNALNSTDTHGQYRVLGDTVLRCAVQQALKQVETGVPYGLPLDICESILARTTHQVQQGVYGPLGSRLEAQLGSSDHHAWIWQANRHDDVFNQAFDHVVVNNYHARACTADPKEIATLRAATELLRDLLPLSSPSVLSHVHLVAVFPPVGYWASTASSSEFRLSGTVFLNQTVLTNTWVATEHLYHEALHQQLYDFRQGHSLLAPDFDRENAPTICSPWNMPDLARGNYWDLHRSLAAFHVYVHLALLATLAEQRAPEFEDRYGPVRLASRRTALSRAHYLHEQLTTAFLPECGPAGTKLVEWFGSILNLLDPAPPPPGAHMHLLLDRYWREAQNIAFLSTQPNAVDVSRDLLILAGEEVQSARGVLAAVNVGAELGKFNSLLASIYDENGGGLINGRGPSVQFARLRGLIAQTILDVSPDGYTLSESGIADNLVRDMVERSSEALIPVIRR